MQSSPWILLGLLVLLLAWGRRSRLGEASQPGIRILMVPIVMVLAVFGLAGIYRHDGMGFSQRYLLELTPFVAIAAGVGLASLKITWPWFVAGAGLGATAAAGILSLGTTPPAFRWQSLLPLGLALLTAGAWLLARVRERWSGLAGLASAACLAWGACIHLATDLPASRLSKHLNDARAIVMEEAIPPATPFAILAANGTPIGFCRLLLSRDVVVVAEDYVAKAELPTLVDALLKHRRILVWLENFPEASRQRLLATYHLTPRAPSVLVELTRPQP